MTGTWLDFLRRKCDPDCDNRLHRAEFRDRHVVVAGAVADAMAAAVEGEQRDEQDVGCDFRSVGLRLADAPLAGRELIAEREGAHDKRLAAPGDRRQRELRAGRRKPAHQRQRIDLGLQRHEAGDDRAGLDRKRKRARRDRLGGLRALRGRNRIAADQCVLADNGFQSETASDICLARQRVRAQRGPMKAPAGIQ